MTLRPSLFALALCSTAAVTTTAAQAEVPNVVTDIAPIQSLAALVMGDLGAPVALMRQGASPHDYALRPSDAEALQSADLVLWTGPELAPWLAEMVGKVAPEAVSVPLAELDGAVELPFREGATFEKHVHGEEGHDDHADHDDHDAHDDHADDDHADDDHADHDHADDDHAGESHDPHSWLDPMNGRIWLGEIATQLAALDPDNAETYRANATAAQAQLDEMIQTISTEMMPLQDMNFIVFHDAYQYFENRFGLSAAGAISLGDATAPSPARIREIQDEIKAQNVTCVFSEPQFSAALVETVLDGTSAKSAVIDPLGVEITPGAGFYGDLIKEVAAAFASCAAE
ncbi:zinc transport system substrate-binding protein [Celeribacter baekdonensis]|uniref:High-affinity zinc uptake system protein ZnuA n=1 Tax=Celeribacter baekdonensis TaxID=875171 RepID=A0A1G7MC44_9RHOB|nr:zinc ABC transporter substrate-binding protein [Celeribacter baekdonensis]SDF59174.1 zinc transport system substrate-binding protein [Celeribacter baekdonensis]